MSDSIQFNPSRHVGGTVRRDGAYFVAAGPSQDLGQKDSVALKGGREREVSPFHLYRGAHAEPFFERTLLLLQTPNGPIRITADAAAAALPAGPLSRTVGENLGRLLSTMGAGGQTEFLVDRSASTAGVLPEVARATAAAAQRVTEEAGAAGIASFSEDTREHMPLSRGRMGDGETVGLVDDMLQQIQGSTMAGQAIQEGSDILAQTDAPRRAPKNLVVLTDGKVEHSDSFNQTLREVRERGQRLLSVGIGDIEREDERHLIQAFGEYVHLSSLSQIPSDMLDEVRTALKPPARESAPVDPAARVPSEDSLLFPYSGPTSTIMAPAGTILHTMQSLAPLLEEKHPVLLVGGPNTERESLARFMGALAEEPMAEIDLAHVLDGKEVVRAVGANQLEGRWILLKNVDLASDDVVGHLSPYLEDRRSVVVATATPSPYPGRTVVDPELGKRFATIEAPQLLAEEMVQIIRGRCPSLDVKRVMQMTMAHNAIADMTSRGEIGRGLEIVPVMSFNMLADWAKNVEIQQTRAAEMKVPFRSAAVTLSNPYSALFPDARDRESLGMVLKIMFGND